MLKGLIKPSVKTSMRGITDSNNYREIMISNNMFKLLEYCLLPLLQKYTSVSSFQLGYKSSYLHNDGNRYYERSLNEV